MKETLISKKTMWMLLSVKFPNTSGRMVKTLCPQGSNSPCQNLSQTSRINKTIPNTQPRLTYQMRTPSPRLLIWSGSVISSQRKQVRWKLSASTLSTPSSVSSRKATKPHQRIMTWEIIVMRRNLCLNLWQGKMRYSHFLTHLSSQRWSFSPLVRIDSCN